MKVVIVCRAVPMLLWARKQPCARRSPLLPGRELDRGWSQEAMVCATRR